jgi:hypothetical protein
MRNSRKQAQLPAQNHNPRVGGSSPSSGIGPAGSCGDPAEVELITHRDRCGTPDQLTFPQMMRILRNHVSAVAVCS